MTRLIDAIDLHQCRSQSIVGCAFLGFSMLDCLQNASFIRLKFHVAGIMGMLGKVSFIHRDGIALFFFLLMFSKCASSTLKYCAAVFS